MKIVVTGIAGSFGRQVVRHLHRRFQVVGIDPRPARHLPKDIEHLQLDYRRRGTEDVFRRHRPDAVIHLGQVHRLSLPAEEASALNIVGTQRLLEFCRQYGTHKFVMLSTADVYGPLPGSDYYITEDTPLQGDLRYPEMRTAVSMDRMVQTFHYMEEGIETVLLRPVHIVSPRLKNAVTSYLKLPRIPVIMGYDPMLHVIHAEDMLAALVHSLEPGIHGVFNIAGTEAAPLSRLLQRLGAPTFPIPAPLARVVVDRLWRYGKLAFPPPEIDHLQYNHVVDLTRMRRELAFEPRHSWHDIIQELKVYRGRMRSR